jgi:multidrug efflux pump subunit AcrA (membrane-fusion protein)
MKKKEKIIWIVLLSIIFISILYFLIVPKKDKFVAVKTGAMVESVYSLATVKTELSYNLRPFVTEKIAKIFITEGDFIYKNAPLLLLDTGLILYSPITGVISKVFMKDSEVLVAGQIVMTIINFDKMYLTASLDQESALKVRRGQKTEISFESIRGEKINGTVMSIYPSGTDFITRISATKLPQGILPEMTADIAIEISRKENVLMIPASTLQTVEMPLKNTGKERSGRRDFRPVKVQKITLIRDGKKITIKPKIGLRNDNWIEVDRKEVFPTDKILLPSSKKSPIRFLILSFVIFAIIFSYRYFKKRREA